MKNNIKGKAKLTSSPQVITHKFNNSYILFNPQNGKIYSLNETASFLWNLITKGATFETLVDKLTEKYNINKPSALKDIREWLKRYLANKLIKKIG